MPIMDQISELKKEIEMLREQLGGHKRPGERLDPQILEAVISNIGTGFVVSDIKGNIIYQNDASQRMHDFRFEHEELETLEEFRQSFTLEYPEGGTVPFEKWPLSLAIKGDYFRDYLIKMINPRSRSRKIRFISYNTVPIYDKNGTKKYIVITMTDLSEIRERTEQLNESRLRYRSLFNNNTLAMAHCRIINDAGGSPVDFEIIQINDAYTRISGLKKDDIEGKRATEVFPGIKSFSYDFISNYGRIASEGGEINEELYDEGFHKYISLYAYSPMKGEFTSIFNDITSRKEMEDKFARERELFEGIFDNIPVMITIYDPEMKDFRFNRELKQILGWTEDDTADGKFMEKVYPDPVYRKEVAEYMQSLTGGWKEMNPTAKDGTKVSSLWANLLLPRGIQIGIGIDIRQRKQAEEALKRSEQRFRGIFSNVAIGILEVDSHNRITSVNDRICHILGYRREELLGKTIYDITAPEDRDLSHEINNKIHSGEIGIIDYEKRYLKSNNTPIWVHVTISGVYDKDGKNINSIGTVEDITNRRKVEETLRESEERFRTLADNISQMVWIVNPKGEPTWFNKRWYDYTGLSLDYVLKNGVGIVLHPDYIYINSDFQQAIKKGLAWESIYPMRRKDGDFRWFLSQALPIYDKAGNISMWFGTSTDVTEHRNIEEALRESEEKFSTAFRTSPYALVISKYDDGEIIEVNDAFLKLFEVTSESIIGRSSISLGMFSDPADRIKAIEILKKEGRVKDLQVRIRQSSGNERFVLISVEVIYLKGMKAMLTTLHDITEEKIAVEAVQRSESILKQAGMMADLGAWELEFNDASDIDNSILRWSDQVFRIFGYTPGSVTVTNDLFYERVHPDDRKKVKQAVLNAMENKNPYTVEHRIIRADGLARTVIENAEIELDHEGNAHRLVGAVQDITHQKQSEESLRKKNEELTRFIYTVSHDLKSPLVTIKSFSNYLQEDIKNNDKESQDRDLNFIRNAADKMARLLDELLELSRIGRKEKPKVNVPLEEVVKAATDLVAGRLEEKKIKVALTGNPVMLYGHSQRFIQLFQNLIDNSAKFMGDQEYPSIEIGSYAGENNEVVLFVRDNGKGIDPRYHHKIFGLFEKMDVETEGTGIGLALVKRIVEVHGGSIWFTSEGEGRGTTFYFALEGATLIK